MSKKYSRDGSESCFTTDEFIGKDVNFVWPVQITYQSGKIMKLQQKYQYCDVCDHRIVPGVACDGQPRECPHQDHPLPAGYDRRCTFPVQAVALALPSEFDAVRGVD
ncbi:MAG: hypothetical protein P8106_06960 [Gammaproteobacteria bacterium]